MLIRSGIALVVAFTVTLGGAYFVHRTKKDRREGRDDFKINLKRQKEAGELKGTSWDVMDLDDFIANEPGTPLTQNELSRLELAAFLESWWYFLAPLVLLASIAATHVVGKVLACCRRCAHSEPAARASG
jgi:hypothetical protein